MDPWYLGFVGCLLFLLLNATQRDRASLWIILTASIVGMMLVVFVTRQIHAPWKLVIPGAVETLTIVALIGIGRNKTAYFQAVLLLVAWWAHLQCYIDLIGNYNVIYDQYEKVIGCVAVGQLLAFYETWFSIGRTAQRWAHLWANGGRVVSPASRSAGVVRTEIDPGE